MNRAVLVAGLRTPFGRAGKGAYANTRPDELAIKLLRGHRTQYPTLWHDPLDDFVVGCAYPEGEQGYNLARMLAIGLGCTAPGVTVNRLCASSLEAAAIAASRIRAGWGRRYLVAGVESMSRIPRRGAHFSESDQIRETNPFAYVPNGDTAEYVARLYPHLTRSMQEAFAARSHELAAAAFDKGRYRAQIHPYLIERDEFIRVPVDREKMQNLAPAFDPTGVVTAATSSPLTDGATCGLILDWESAMQSGLPWGLEIIEAAAAHVAPELMGLGPVAATQIVLDRGGVTPAELQAIEMNEAFAIQVLASIDLLSLPMERVNTWGGAIALGHPLGASGLRLLITLLDRLAERAEPGALGLATLCVGGGQGMSVLGRLTKLT